METEKKCFDTRFFIDFRKIFGRVLVHYRQLIAETVLILAIPWQSDRSNLILVQDLLYLATVFSVKVSGIRPMTPVLNRGPLEDI